MDLLKIWCCTEAAMLLHPKRIIQGARSALVVDAAMHCTGAAQNRTADPGCAWMFPPIVSGHRHGLVEDNTRQVLKWSVTV